jgi:hypothetical protein
MSSEPKVSRREVLGTMTATMPRRFSGADLEKGINNCSRVKRVALEN